MTRNTYINHSNQQKTLYEIEIQEKYKVYRNKSGTYVSDAVPLL